MASKFDLKIIPEYDGSGLQSVVEWLEKLELVCKLQGADSDVAKVIPLRLTGGAFAVYLQLSESDRQSADKVKKALLAAFAADPYVAYDQFVNRRLREGESPDVYLAELRRLATLFGGMTDKGLACAFVSGLPEEIRQLLRAGSRMEDLDLNQILTRTRAVVKDDAAHVSSETSLGAIVNHGVEQCAVVTHQRCFVCSGPNHLARDCLARRQSDTSGGAGSCGSKRSRRKVKCFRCGGLGHFASACSGNERGEETSVPVSSHGNQ